MLADFLECIPIFPQEPGNTIWKPLGTLPKGVERHWLHYVIGSVIGPSVLIWLYSMRMYCVQVRGTHHRTMS